MDLSKGEHIYKNKNAVLGVLIQIPTWIISLFFLIALVYTANAKLFSALELVKHILTSVDSEFNQEI